jgi:hypothetical protein
MKESVRQSYSIEMNIGLHGMIRIVLDPITDRGNHSETMSLSSKLFSRRVIMLTLQVSMTRPVTPQLPRQTNEALPLLLDRGS